jgi:hypothetical protein
MEDFKVVSCKRKHKVKFPYGYNGSRDVIKILDFVSQITVLANKLYSAFWNAYPKEYSFDYNLSREVMEKCLASDFEFMTHEHDMITSATFGGIFRRLLSNEDIYGGDIDVYVFTSHEFSQEEFFNIVGKCFQEAVKRVLKVGKVQTYYHTGMHSFSRSEYSCIDLKIPLKHFRSGSTDHIKLSLCSDVNGRQYRNGFPCDMTYDALAVMSKTCDNMEYVATSGIRREKETVTVKYNGSPFKAPGGAFLTPRAFEEATRILSSPNQFYNPGTMWFPTVSENAKSLWLLASKKPLGKVRSMFLTYDQYKLYLRSQGLEDKTLETLSDDTVIFDVDSNNNKIEWFDLEAAIEKGEAICRRACKLASMGYFKDCEEHPVDDPLTQFYIDVYVTACN